MQHSEIDFSLTGSSSDENYRVLRDAELAQLSSTSPVWCIAATDEHIYSCSADKSIIIWSMDDAKRGIATQRARLTMHTDVVYALRLAFGSLFSSSADKTIKRYELGTHRQTPPMSSTSKAASRVPLKGAAPASPSRHSMETML